MEALATHDSGGKGYDKELMKKVTKAIEKIPLSEISAQIASINPAEASVEHRKYIESYQRIYQSTGAGREAARKKKEDDSAKPPEGGSKGSASATAS